MLLADFLPAIALGSWFGMCADRYSRRRLIVGANLFQAAAFGALIFARTALPIIALALVAGVGNAMLRPALRSALPGVAGNAKQVAAALYEMCRYIGMTRDRASRPACSPCPASRSHSRSTPLASCRGRAMMATVALDRPSPSATTQRPRRADRIVRAGLTAAFATPGIAAVVGCSAGSIIAGGLLNVCEPILATHVLGGSSSDYALLVAIYGAGMVTASVLVARRGTVPDGILVRRYLAALALTAVGMAASASVRSILPATLAFAATGYANALLLISETQLIQVRVPNAVQGRLFGAKDTLEGACFLIALVAAGVLVASTGVRFTLTIGAIVCGVCALAGVCALRGAALWRPTALSAAGRRSYAASGRSSSDATIAGASTSTVGADTTSISA